MTQQQMQYAYWQRMRQQALYRAYAAGYATKAKEYQGLCFTAEYPDSTVMLQNVVGQYQTSVDGQNWSDYTVGQDTIMLSKVGDKVYFAAKDTNANCYKETDDDNRRFIMTGKIAASGNIQSLLDKECQRMDVPLQCYSSLFKDCESLTKPPTLPATTLAEQCYDAMFLNCTALTTAPELPAKNIVERCYQFMFKGCSSLTAAPELPAAVTPFCYDTMFENCTSLTSAPLLSSKVLCDHCYANMFKGCTSLKISENESLGSIVLDTTDMTKEQLEYASVTDMFSGTNGTFKESPTARNIYRCYQ